MKIHYFTAAGDTWAIWDCPFDGQNFYFLARGDASCMSDAEIDIPDPNSFISNDKYDVYEYFNTEYGVYDTVHYNIYGSSIISRPCLHVSNHLEATAYSVIRDTGGNVLHSPDINTITGTKDYMFFVPGYSWAKDDISIRSKKENGEIYLQFARIGFDGRSWFVYRRFYGCDDWQPELLRYSSYQWLTGFETREEAEARVNECDAAGCYPYYREWVPVVHTKNASTLPTNAQIEDAKHQISKHVKKLRSEIIESHNVKATTGRLTYLAARDLGTWNGNGIAYVKDILDIYSSLRSSVNTLDDIRKHLSFSKRKRQTVRKKLRKDASDAYLSVHFGYKLMAADTAELLSALKARKDRYIHLTANVSNKNVISRLTSVYDCFTDSVSELDKLMSDFDMKLTAENTWDMIPFSFVVDWFVKVGNVLNTWDNYSTLTTRYDHVISHRSDIAKETIAIPIGVSGLTLTLDTRIYVRVPIETVYMPTPSSEDIISRNPLTHWVEGLALYSSLT